MRIVLDCNIIVICLTSRSPYHTIYKALVNGKFELLLSQEILLEYEEIIQVKYGIATARSFMVALSLVTQYSLYTFFLQVESDTYRSG